jgi:hypothetical protein
MCRAAASNARRDLRGGKSRMVLGKLIFFHGTPEEIDFAN